MWREVEENRVDHNEDETRRYRLPELSEIKQGKENGEKVDNAAEEVGRQMRQV